MAYPLVTVEFSPTTNPLDSPSWVDITSSVIGGIETYIGRTAENDEFASGSLTLQLQDRSRDFDSSNSSGTYSPNIKPRKRIRVRSGATVLFTGYVQSWSTAYDLERKDIITTVTAFDDLTLMAGMDIAGSPYAFTVQGYSSLETYHRCNDGPNTALCMESVSGINAALAGSYKRLADEESATLDTTSRDFVRMLSGSMVWANSFNGTAPNDQSFECWFRWQAPVNAAMDLVCEIGAISSTIQVAPYVTVNGGTVSAPGRALNDGLWHHIVVTSNSTTAKIYVDGVEEGSGAWAQKLFTQTGGRNGFTMGPKFTVGSSWIALWADIKEVAIYSSVLTAAQVLNNYNAGKGWPGDTSGARITRLLDAAGWKSGDRSIDTGDCIVSPIAEVSGNLLDLIKTYTKAEFGKFYVKADGTVTFKSRYDFNEDTRSLNTQATYGHSGSDLRYVGATPTPDDVYLFNSIRTSIVGSDIVNLAQDATSIAAYYQIGAYDLTGLELASNNDAVGLGQLLLARYKDLTPRISSLVVNARAGSSEMAAVIGHQIGDRVVVKHKPNNVGTDVTYTCYIESIAHSINLTDLTWFTTLTLSPVFSTSFFILGTDALGGATVIGH